MEQAFFCAAPSSSPLSQKQSPRFPPPDSPAWYGSLPPLGFVQMDRQSLSDRGAEHSPSYRCWRYIPGDSASTPFRYPGQQHTSSISHSVHPRLSGPLPLPTFPSSTLCAAVAQAPSLSRNNIEFPWNLQGLHWLMEAAHKPGNGMYLAKVKALCTEAHNTPTERKTELQKVLLSKWRNPVPLGIAQVSLINPRIDDSVDIWYYYLCTHQKSWPRGVRKDLLGRPIMSDLRANRIISRLRPTESSSSNPVSSRTAFVQQVVDIFSRPGTYQRILVRKHIDVAHSLSYLRFHERTWFITIEDIVRHFAACGITVEMATRDFEPWARNYLEISYEIRRKKDLTLQRKVSYFQI